MAILRAYHFLRPLCTKGIHERRPQRNFAAIDEITILDLSESRLQMRIFYKNLQMVMIILSPVGVQRWGWGAAVTCLQGQIFQKGIEFGKGAGVGQGWGIVAAQFYGMFAEEVDFAADSGEVLVGGLAHGDIFANLFGGGF